MPVSARSNGGPAAMSSPARFSLPFFRLATIATRPIGSSCLRRSPFLRLGASACLLLASSLLRVDVLERVAGIRVGAGLGKLDRGVDYALRLGIESRPLLLAQREPLAEVLDRIARLPQLP